MKAWPLPFGAGCSKVRTPLESSLQGCNLVQAPHSVHLIISGLLFNEGQLISPWTAPERACKLLCGMFNLGLDLSVSWWPFSRNMQREPAACPSSSKGQKQGAARLSEAVTSRHTRTRFVRVLGWTSKHKHSLTADVADSSSMLVCQRPMAELTAVVSRMYWQCIVADTATAKSPSFQ